LWDHARSVNRSFLHPVLGAVNVRADIVPDGGDEQTAAVIRLMTEYAVQDSRSAAVRDAVREAQIAYPGLSPEEQIFYYVRGRVRFVEDEVTALPIQTWYQEPIVEALIRPVDLLAQRPVAQGDCDDFSMLVAAMLLAQEIPCSYVTVAADPRDPRQFSHVYVASYRDGKRFSVDASHGEYPGWEAESPYRRTEWPVADEEMVRNRALALAIALAAGVYILCR